MGRLIFKFNLYDFFLSFIAMINNDKSLLPDLAIF